MKFYFMIGLPTETDEDVSAIAQLGQKVLTEGLRQNRKAEINLGVSAFVPKPFTPFQWEPQNSLAETHQKLNRLRSQIRTRRLHLKPHKPETTYLEGIFARGDRPLAKLIVRAWEKGCRFDEWDEGLKFHLWREAWEECGIDPHFYVERRRGREERLPWDHLFIDMKKEWLWEEYEASVQAAFVDDCSTGKCSVCGVCDYKEVRNRAYELPRYDAAGKLEKRKTTTEVRAYIPPVPPVSLRGGQGEIHPGFSYQCTYTKSGPASLLSHLEFVDHIRRAAARAELPVKFSQGFHPQPRISFGNASPVGCEVSDSFTIHLLRSVKPEDLYQHFNQTLPDGIRLLAPPVLISPP
ncbi:MAG: DUF2344 domain-containing protein [Deltaproteobacteria bacterium]|nr:DUF2344 domain-containing protein [Deltaproteobacteria bacterium]